MIVSSGCLSYEETNERKAQIFGELSERGVELYYDKERDELFIDMNNTLTDKDLAILTLEYLDELVAKDAEEILKMNALQSFRVECTVKLIKGRTKEELEKAGKRAVDEASVPEYLAACLKSLKPTKLTISTHLPQEVAEQYKESKIRPLYGDDEVERGAYIEMNSMLLDEDNGVYTGTAYFIPDERFRDLYRNFLLK